MKLFHYPPLILKLGVLLRVLDRLEDCLIYQRFIICKVTTFRINQSIKQSINQSINQSIKQTINRMRP